MNPIARMLSSKEPCPLCVSPQSLLLALSARPLRSTRRVPSQVCFISWHLPLKSVSLSHHIYVSRSPLHCFLSLLGCPFCVVLSTRSLSHIPCSTYSKRLANGRSTPQLMSNHGTIFLRCVSSATNSARRFSAITSSSTALSLIRPFGAKSGVWMCWEASGG